MSKLYAILVTFILFFYGPSFQVALRNRPRESSINSLVHPYINWNNKKGKF